MKSIRPQSHSISDLLKQQETIKQAHEQKNVNVNESVGEEIIKIALHCHLIS
jgi:hypothetical protein